MIRQQIKPTMSGWSKDASVTTYLQAIAALAMEVAREPRLLPVFLGVIRLVPRTVEALQRARRLAA
jgi:hypothetical protein